MNTIDLQIKEMLEEKDKRINELEKEQVKLKANVRHIITKIRTKINNIESVKIKNKKPIKLNIGSLKR